MDDSWVSAGQTKTITAITSLQDRVGPVQSDLVIDGSAETNGNLRILAGSGNDTIQGAIMVIDVEEQRRAFGRWLMTGRLPTVRVADGT